MVICTLVSTPRLGGWWCGMFDVVRRLSVVSVLGSAVRG